METRNIKHVLSDLVKGQIYFTKNKTHLLEKVYHPVYYIHEHDYSDSSMFGNSIYSADMNLRTFPLVYAGILTINTSKELTPFSYHAFVFGEKTYTLKGIEFFKDMNSMHPTYTFNCNLINKEPVYPVKLENIFDK